MGQLFYFYGCIGWLNLVLNDNKEMIPSRIHCYSLKHFWKRNLLLTGISFNFFFQEFHSFFFKVSIKNYINWKLYYSSNFSPPKEYILMGFLIQGFFLLFGQEKHFCLNVGKSRISQVFLGYRTCHKLRQIFFWKKPLGKRIGRVWLRRLHECLASSLLKELCLLINRF